MKDSARLQLELDALKTEHHRVVTAYQARITDLESEVAQARVALQSVTPAGLAELEAASVTESSTPAEPPKRKARLKREE